MKLDRYTAVALFTLGAGIAASGLLGPLVTGAIEFRVSETMENQLVGGEIISLAVAAPLAIVAGVLWLRGHRLAPVLALGPALYSIYMYVQYVIGPDYTRYEGNNENFFPLYLTLVILGWAIVIRAWPALGAANLQPPSTRLRRVTAGILLFLSVVFTLAWTASIVDVLNGGRPVEEHEKDPTLFWMIRLMDLGFVIPAGLITGIGLLRNALWADRLVYALMGVQTLLTGAVAGMAVVMELRDDPASNPALLVVTVTMTLVLGLIYALLLKGALRAVTAPRKEAALPRVARAARG
jgi:hypothetical protein